MEREKRVYQVIYKNDCKEYITGYQNLPEKSSVKEIKRVKQKTQSFQRAKQRLYWVMYALELDKCKTPETMALRDDILLLHGGIPIGFPKLHEYKK